MFPFSSLVMQLCLLPVSYFNLPKGSIRSFTLRIKTRTCTKKNWNNPYHSGFISVRLFLLYGFVFLSLLCVEIGTLDVSIVYFIVVGYWPEAAQETVFCAGDKDSHLPGKMTIHQENVYSCVIFNKMENCMKPGKQAGLRHSCLGLEQGSSTLRIAETA